MYCTIVVGMSLLHTMYKQRENWNSHLSFTGITMQSEEIEDIRSNVDEPLPNTEMTYTDNGELSSPRLKPPVITEDSK